MEDWNYAKFGRTGKRLRHGILGIMALVLVLATFTLIQAQVPSPQPYAPSSTPASLRRLPTPLSSDLPFDVDIPKVRELDKEGKIAVAQREFDILAWQAFIALNWPADTAGKPMSAFDDKSPRIWSFWRPAGKIFQTDGSPPDPWTGTNSTANYTLSKTKAAWRQDTTSADENLQAFSGPLVDQNGNWVRYEVLVNKEEFNYIVNPDRRTNSVSYPDPRIQHELYNLEGQAAFSQKEDDNQIAFPVDDAANGKHGAMEIKLAWKKLEANDDPKRFYVAHIRVNVAEPTPAGQTKPTTKDFDAGLVGMHIAMHTQSSPEWIWATFEQIDNVRVNYDAAGRPVRPNFYDPDHFHPLNVLPAKNAVPDPVTGLRIAADPANASTWIESETRTPVQVARIPLPTQGGLNSMDAELAEGAADLNTQVESLFAEQKSAFQYYKLIGTQWPVHPNAPAFAGGAGSAPESIRFKTPGYVVPVFLVNTTMETYFQLGLQPAGPLEQDDRLAGGSAPIDATPVYGTESCVGCHYSAGMCLGFKQDNSAIYGENNHFGATGGANFSWLLQIEAHHGPLPKRLPRQHAPQAPGVFRPSGQARAASAWSR